MVIRWLKKQKKRRVWFGVAGWLVLWLVGIAGFYFLTFQRWALCRLRPLLSRWSCRRRELCTKRNSSDWQRRLPSGCWVLARCWAGPCRKSIPILRLHNSSLARLLERHKNIVVFPRRTNRINQSTDRPTERFFSFKKKSQTLNDGLHLYSLSRSIEKSSKNLANQPRDERRQSKNINMESLSTRVPSFYSSPGTNPFMFPSTS